MKIIKLNAIDSTNSFMKQLLAERKLDNGTIVCANHQFEGRGQMGTKWLSKAGKNLTFSIYKRFVKVPLERSFYVSIAVSLAIYSALKSLQIQQLSIKWSNDILSANEKICGILIENMVKGQKLDGVVIGVGLNVNQDIFDGLMNVSSLKNLTGIHYNLDELLQQLIKQFTIFFERLENEEFSMLKVEYENLLFKKDKPAMFKDKNNAFFMGFIRGINSVGKLKVELEDGVFKEFELKEIILLY